MRPDLRLYIDAVWCALAIVWLVGAATAKRTARHERVAGRLLHVGLLAVAMTLLFAAARRGGPLAGRFVPRSPASAYAGLALTVAGVAFAIWARVMLGGNWSGIVTIKEDHTLVRSGPYRLVRHPIYTGIWAGLVGTALAYGEIRGLIGAGVALLSFWLKSRIEEKLLTEQFGEQYARYRREVKALIPFVL